MTAAQQHKFFKLCELLGYDKEEAKERAKAKYSKVHFLDLDTTEIAPLIQLMERELEKEQNKPAKKEDPLIEPKENFPFSCRVWDKEEQVMIYGGDIILALEYVKDPEKLSNKYYLMFWTGKEDEQKQPLYDSDIFKSYTGKQYVIGWNWKECAWVGYDMETDESMFLGSFGKVWKIGNALEGIKK